MLFTGIALTLMAIVAVTVHWVRGGRFLGPVSVGWGGYLLLISGMLIMAHYEGAMNPQSDIRSYTLFLFVTASLGYLIGLYLTNGQFVARFLPAPTPNPSGFTLWFLLGVCFLLGTSMSYLIERGEGTSIIGALKSSAMGGAILVSAYGMLRPRAFILNRLLFLSIFLATFLVIYATSWSRRPIMGIVLILFGWFYLRFAVPRGTGFKVVVVLGIVVLALIGNQFLQATRYQRTRAGNTFFAEGFFDYENYRNNVRGVTIGYDVCEEVVKQYRDYDGYGGRGFHYGETYACGLLFFIPRQYWPSKPQAGGFYASSIWAGGEDYKSSVSATPVGEAYMNFGVVGPFFVCMLAGYLIRCLDTFLADHRDNLFLQFIWLSLAFDFIGQFRGDFTSMYVHPLVRVALVYGLLWAAGYLGRVFNPDASAPVLSVNRSAY